MEDQSVELQGVKDLRDQPPQSTTGQQQITGQQPLHPQEGPMLGTAGAGNKGSAGGHMGYVVCIIISNAVSVLLLVSLGVSVYLHRAKISELQDENEATKLSLSESYCNHDSWTTKTTCSKDEEDCTCAVFVGGHGQTSVNIIRVDANGKTCKVLSGIYPHRLAYYAADGLFYWSRYPDGEIYQATASGTCSEVTSLTDGNWTDTKANDLAVDESRGLLFAAFRSGIVRAEITGANPVTIISDNQKRLEKLVLHEDKQQLLYWDEENGTILRADYDGQNEEVIVSDVLRVAGLAVDKTSNILFWVTYYPDTIFSVSLDNLEEVMELGEVAGRGQPYDLEMCGNHLYILWSLSGSISHVYEFSIATRKSRKIEHPPFVDSRALTLAPVA